MTMPAERPYIAIEGVIGVGKTTLARLLQSRFGSRDRMAAETILEAFDENPFLSDFYGDRARYAFQTQIFFLLSRYRQQQRAPELLKQGALLSDYIFDKDKLFAHLNIRGEDELEMYDRLYEALAEKVQPPDLVVYLRAKVDTLMARIAMRDRTYERQMDRNYIAALRQGYEHLFADYEAVPLLVIESDALDFVQSPNDLDAIEQQIRSMLAGVRQPMLPTISISQPESPAWRLVPTSSVRTANGGKLAGTRRFPGSGRVGRAGGRRLSPATSRRSRRRARGDSYGLGGCVSRFAGSGAAHGHPTRMICPKLEVSKPSQGSVRVSLKGSSCDQVLHCCGG